MCGNKPGARYRWAARCNSSSCCVSRKSGTFAKKPVGPAHTRAAPAEGIKASRRRRWPPERVDGGNTEHQPGGKSGAWHTGLGMVSSQSLHLRTKQRTQQEPDSVVQMIGKYFSQMSNRRGSVESCDERDASSPGKNVLISVCGYMWGFGSGGGGGS